MLGDLWTSILGQASPVLSVVSPIVVYAAGFSFFLVILGFGAAALGSRHRAAAGMSPGSYSPTGGANGIGGGFSLGSGSRAVMPSLKMGEAVAGPVRAFIAGWGTVPGEPETWQEYAYRKEGRHGNKGDLLWNEDADYSVPRSARWRILSGGWYPHTGHEDLEEIYDSL